jgi:hypothetical protein
LSFIRVDARGLRQGKPKHVIYELLDYRDLDTGFTAIQRTVGFTMNRGAQLIATGKLSKPGLLTPLHVAYDDVVPELEPHGIRVRSRALVGDGLPKPASRIHHQAMTTEAFAPLQALIQPDAEPCVHICQDRIFTALHH